MDIRIPKELLDYLDTVRGEKSRQAYLVNLLSEEYNSTVLLAILSKNKPLQPE